MFVEAFFEEVVGEYARLREAVDAAVDFEVYPAIVDYGGKVVFGNELIGDVVNFDADIFVSVKWGAEVEVFDVKACKFCVCSGEDAVENEFDEF